MISLLLQNHITTFGSLINLTKKKLKYLSLISIKTFVYDCCYSKQILFPPVCN